MQSYHHSHVQKVMLILVSFLLFSDHFFIEIFAFTVTPSDLVKSTALC